MNKLPYTLFEAFLMTFIVDTIRQSGRNEISFRTHHLEKTNFPVWLEKRFGIVVNPSTISRAWRNIRQKGVLNLFNLQILHEETCRRNDGGRGRGETQWTLTLINSTSNSPQTMTPLNSKEAS